MARLYITLFRHLSLGILTITIGFFQEVENLSTSLWLISGTVISTVGFILTLVSFIVRKKKKQWFQSFNLTYNKVVPSVLREEVSNFKHLSLDLIKRLLLDRATSAVTMLQSVFLNQIRRLNYDGFYKNPHLELMRITSRVDELDGKDTVYKKFKIAAEIKIPASDQLKSVAIVAAETPTTLWWDDTDIKVKRMDSLIACGQFTTCYNLLIYVIELKKTAITSPEIAALEIQLRIDWKKFNDNPYWLV